MTDNITGRTYLEHNKPVRVLARWSGERAGPMGWHPACCAPPSQR